MTITNINLQSEIDDWLAATYGEEVRAANVRAFQKIQGTVNDTIQEVTQAATDVQDAAAAAQTAIQTANNLVTVSTQAVTNAQDSATLSESWAIGGTGTRSGEDTDNSKYYSLQSGLSAEAAQNAADKAEMYAGFVIPDFVVNLVTGELEYTTSDDIVFTINTVTGNLEYQLVA